MAKEIVVLYQDCVLCGDKGKKKALELEARGYTFRKVSFVTKEGEELSARAVAAGVGSMPVFFYGEHVAATLDKLMDQIRPKKGRKSKKTEELKDGAVPEV